MAVKIADIHFAGVKKPLKRSFATVLETVEYREATVVVVRDTEGYEGYGECVAFDTPWYTEETVTGSRFVMERVLAPLLVGKELQEAGAADRLFAKVKGNHMAKAALEMAVWDLFAKRAGVALSRFVGGTRDKVPAGVVVTGGEEEMRRQTEAAAAAGYRRIKLKFSPGSDAKFLAQLVKQYPHISFYADANGSFSDFGMQALLPFDNAGLALIEQPFAEQDWAAHRAAKKAMKTPICLDESITGLADVKRMENEEAGDIVVLKMGRLGGWAETLRVVEFCKQHGIGMWVGGMIEFGVSKAHNLALASINEITLIGDFSDSGHYWEQDIVSPEIRVERGEIKLKKNPGIGYRLNL